MRMRQAGQLIARHGIKDTGREVGRGRRAAERVGVERAAPDGALVPHKCPYPVPREAVAEHGLAVFRGGGEEDAVGGWGAVEFFVVVLVRERRSREEVVRVFFFPSDRLQKRDVALLLRLLLLGRPLRFSALEHRHLHARRGAERKKMQQKAGENGAVLG